MFKRRERQPIIDRLREALAPRKGWRRGYLYLGRRMQRLPDTPHKIALGFSCGVLASFTPFFGFHFVVAALFALVARGNLLASAFGTFFGNPLTFPLIASSAIWMGQWLTGMEVLPPEDGYGFGWLWENLEAIFLPYLAGGALPGLAAGVAVYVALRPMVAAYQNRRRNRLMARTKDRLRAGAVKVRARAEAHAAARARRHAEGGAD